MIPESVPELHLPPLGVIENPVSGERITIHTRAEETAGRLFVFELVLDPGGHVPNTHIHPEQEERFTVLEGKMRFRVAGNSFDVGPGETVAVTPGRAHHFANAGQETARLMVEVRPALDMEAMLTSAARLAREDHAAGRHLPRVLNLALFMRRFEREVQVPFVPPSLVRILTVPLARLAISRNRRL